MTAVKLGEWSRPRQVLVAMVGMLVVAALVAVVLRACGGDDGGSDEEAADLVLGAPLECEGDPACLPGLADVYDIDLTGGFVPLTREMAPESLRSGEIDIGVVYATSPAMAEGDLVVLEDDQEMLPVDNLLPIASKELADAYGSDLSEVLDVISAELTTEDLTQMNVRYDVDQDDAETIAADWLTDHGLGEDDSSGEEDEESGGPSKDGPAITIGVQDFSESVIIGEIYRQVLLAGGFDAETRSVGGAQPLLYDAFDRGNINLAAGYLATELNYLADEAVATSDVDESLRELDSVLADHDLVPYDPSDAASASVFVMTEGKADDLGVASLSDLADLD